MKIHFFCPRWGSENIAWEDFVVRVKDSGFDGIEFGVSRHMTPSELDTIFNHAAKQNLLLIPQHHDTSEGDYRQHCDLFAAWFKKIFPFQPLFINSQTGKDFFTLDENNALFDIAESFTATTGIQVYHETHRSKALFAAHVSKKYFEARPLLPITLDMSHWVCVAESLLHDQRPAMELAVQHTRHIHARVGYPEGPQVPDPFVPEWHEALDAHLFWWDKIVADNRAGGTHSMTITPEFGPYPYMVHLPNNQQPIANQWELNEKMMTLLRSRYQVR